MNCTSASSATCPATPEFLFRIIGFVGQSVSQSPDCSVLEDVSMVKCGVSIAVYPISISLAGRIPLVSVSAARHIIGFFIRYQSAPHLYPSGVLHRALAAAVLTLTLSISRAFACLDQEWRVTMFKAQYLSCPTGSRDRSGIAYRSDMIQRSIDLDDIRTHVHPVNL